MTKKILNWAEEAGHLDRMKPLPQLARLFEVQGELAKAVLHEEKPSVSQYIAEATIQLVILAEICGIDYDTCVKDGFYKGDIATNQAQECAMLQDVNSVLRIENTRLKEKEASQKEIIRTYELRTVVFPCETVDPETGKIMMYDIEGKTYVQDC